MKYFNSNNDHFWGSKINFADENNVLVGFDYYENCCEDFGWFVCNTVNPDGGKDSIVDCDTTNAVIDKELEGWVFDKHFFEEIKLKNEKFNEYNLAVFRIMKEGQERYLHLYNGHNGYYSHGFEFVVDGKINKKGCL